MLRSSAIRRCGGSRGSYLIPLKFSRFELAVAKASDSSLESIQRLAAARAGSVDCIRLNGTSTIVFPALQSKVDYFDRQSRLLGVGELIIDNLGIALSPGSAASEIDAAEGTHEQFLDQDIADAEMIEEAVNYALIDRTTGSVVAYAERRQGGSECRRAGTWLDLGRRVGPCYAAVFGGSCD